MLLPGHIYKVIRGAYNGIKVLLIDFNSNMTIKAIDIDNGNDVILCDFSSLVESEPITRFYFQVDDKTFEISDDGGKTFKRIVSSLHSVKNNGYKNIEYFYFKGD